jgi:hypothetical protein
MTQACALQCHHAPLRGVSEIRRERRCPVKYDQSHWFWTRNRLWVEIADHLGRPPAMAAICLRTPRRCGTADALSLLLMSKLLYGLCRLGVWSADRHCQDLPYEIW